MADEDLSKTQEAVADTLVAPETINEPQTIGDAMGKLDDAAVHGVDIDIVAILGTRGGCRIRPFCWGACRSYR
jgi:hypothetical protein